MPFDFVTVVKSSSEHVKRLSVMIPFRDCCKDFDSPITLKYFVAGNNQDFSSQLMLKYFVAGKLIDHIFLNVIKVI